ncbi:MAG: ketosteroid isomerase-like protein [Candidatus Paceibacteria bacterium]|jgi:ketosteroid isomerase-like protein
MTKNEPAATLNLQATVMTTEREFALTMELRDFEAFTTFLSEDATFFTGESVLRGKLEVANAWEPYFNGDIPPFAWEPKQVEVLRSGDLAHSSGPVFDEYGNHIANFASVWRLESDGCWRIVFDKGNPVPQ